MLSLNKTLDIAISIRSATARLTDTILGKDEHDLAETLRTVASEIGMSSIAYVRVSPDDSGDACPLFTIVTNSKIWKQRYSLKKFLGYDPVISHSGKIDEPFDWTNLPEDDPLTRALSADSRNQNVGRNGLSVPLHGRRSLVSVVSFTNDLSKQEWEAYKATNMNSLKLLAVLIDAASHVNFKPPAIPVRLSNSRGAVFALGSARQNLSKDCHDPGLSL